EFILIDDQCENGWGQVLCKMLGASAVSAQPEGSSELGEGCEGRLRVSFSRSPDLLLSHIDKARSGGQSFRVRLGSKCDHQILCLDLRLFSNKTLEEEVIFFERLIRIARERFCHPVGLPWPGFAEAELDRIHQWINSVLNGQQRGRSDSRYLEALTLLPRI